MHAEVDQQGDDDDGGGGSSNKSCRLEDPAGVLVMAPQASKSHSGMASEQAPAQSGMAQL